MGGGSVVHATQSFLPEIFTLRFLVNDSLLNGLANIA